MATNFDVPNLSDADLAALYQELSDEQVRRSNREQIRGNIQKMLKDFVEWGGEASDLSSLFTDSDTAVNDGVGEPPTEETSVTTETPSETTEDSSETQTEIPFEVFAN